MESYDAFMIGLPKEMKSTAVGTPKIDTKWIGYPKLKINVKESPAAAAKRKRSDDNMEIEKPSNSQPFSSPNHSAFSSPNHQFQKAPIQLPSHVSKSVPKIGSGISVKKVIPKTTDATTVSVTSDFNNSENDDVIFVSSAEPLKDPKKSLNAAFNNTNFQLYMTENRTISPSHTDRRQTITSPLVSVPKKEPSEPNMMEFNTSNKNILMKSRGLIIGKTGDKVTEIKTKNGQVIELVEKNGRKILLSKATPITPTGQSVEKGNETRLNVTLPSTRSLATQNQSGSQSMNEFKCDQCPYTTGIKSNFVRHALVHKRFKCKHCPMSFIQKIKLISHLSQNHKELQSDITKYWEGI